MTKLFGTDGIRGIANAYPMDGQTAMAVGSAVATFFRSTAPDRNVVPIGQDTRLSGDMIANAVSAGICSAGLNVSLLGVVPTPAVAFFARTLDDAAGGIVISASHNPYSDNGIKVFDSKGTKLSDADETLIEHQLAGGLGKPANQTFRHLKSDESSHWGTAYRITLPFCGNRCRICP
jgi:phosphoglucosamine mutase